MEKTIDQRESGEAHARPIEERRPWLFWSALLALATLAIALPYFGGWLSAPPSNGSLLENGALSVEGAMGIPRHIVRGPLAIEGADFLGTERVLALGNRGGSIAVDLGEPVEIRALLVQALSDSWLEVEVSLDGEQWQGVWSVEGSFEGRGLRTRHQILEPARLARHLRLRNRGASGFAVVSALRAHAEVPPGWPTVGPTTVLPVSAYPWLDRKAVINLKLGIALAGAVLLVIVWWPRRAGILPARRPRMAATALVVVACVAGLGWWNLLQISSEEQAGRFFGYVDTMHYYLGSKYAPELEYTRLYHCILVADDEAGLGSVRLLHKKIRNLSDNTHIGTRALMDDSEACTDRFSTERWQAFQADQAMFRSINPPRAQLPFLHDHGYNGSPVWGIAGWAVGKLGPADDLRVGLATAIDPILLVLSFGFIWATFGFRATCAALVLVGTGHAFGNWFSGGGFLRFGWFAASTAGVCLLKRERWALAGFALALATLLRLFPGFLIGGVGVYALVEMIRERRILPSPPMLRFAAGVSIGIVTLVGLSIAVAGSAEVWPGFVANSIKHQDTSGAQNLGFESFTDLFHDMDVSGRDRYFGSGKPPDPNAAPSPKRYVVLAAAAATFVLLALAARREEPWVCALLGLCWLTFASEITNYYYFCAVLFPLLCVRAPVLVAPFALLTVAWALVGVLFDYLNFYLFAWSSAALVVFSLSALAYFGLGPFGLGPAATPEGAAEAIE